MGIDHAVAEPRRSDGQLGDERAMVDLITAGKLDGGGFSEAGLTVLVPDMIVWRYPGCFVPVTRSIAPRLL